MTAFDWQHFLKNWSQAILASPDVDYFGLPKKAVKSAWLGFDGAGEEQITRAEAKLGTRLPSSYRAFLKASNGWRHTGNFIGRILSVEKIYWLRDARDKSLIEHARLYISQMEEIPFDPDYDEVDYSHFLDTLVIARPTEEQELFLLNPRVQDDAGEWQTWVFTHWAPGAYAYDSFQALLEAEYETVLEESEFSAQRITPDDDAATLGEKLDYLIKTIEKDIAQLRPAPPGGPAEQPVNTTIDQQAAGMQEVLEHIIAIRHADAGAKKIRRQLDQLVRQYEGQRRDPFAAFPSGQESIDLINELMQIKDLNDPNFAMIMSRMFQSPSRSAELAGHSQALDRLRRLLNG